MTQPLFVGHDCVVIAGNGKCKKHCVIVSVGSSDGGGSLLTEALT